MAVFEKEGKRFPFPIGVEADMLFIQDPHELYKHWPAEVWRAIENHQVKAGMNELQASFAIGIGVPEGSGTSDPRVVNYPNQGHPVKVTFENGKATDVKESS